jgi:3'(2'), 5'-bisphosphate nucleotidase
MDELIRELATHGPGVARWAGAVARRLRGYDIALGGKTSGSAETDALTLADLSCQELILAALRDLAPALLACRVEAEEKTGDLGRFATESPNVLALDPIDGTKPYRDRTHDGYAVMLHLRDAERVRYSLVYLPEEGGTNGSWLEVSDSRVVLGPDNPGRPARAVLDELAPIRRKSRASGRLVSVGGFQRRDAEVARLVTATGLTAVPPGGLTKSLYPLLASGEVAGALIHTPNVYDFPVCIQLARRFGGDAVWVHDRTPVHFRETWRDERADMIRLPGIVACAVDPAVLNTLADLARDWSPIRYAD